MISKQEFQSRVDQIEANVEQLMMPETAKKFILSLGIMQDAEIASPHQMEQGKVKNMEEAKRAGGIIKKLAQEKK